MTDQPQDSAALDQLERQVERGQLFTHTALSNNAERIIEMETFVYGLIDLLVEKGLATAEEISDKAQAVHQEMVQKGETLGPGIVMRLENPDTPREDFVPVNCAERIHICQAICCKLSFALTAPEIESGHVKWDLGRPYAIRHEPDGYCTHQNRETRGCGVYDHRPGICRRYSCANDERIWSNFDAMELNTAWINDQLGADDRPKLARIAMIRLEDITNTG